MKKVLIRKKRMEEHGKELPLPPATIREELWDLLQRRMG